MRKALKNTKKMPKTQRTAGSAKKRNESSAEHQAVLSEAKGSDDKKTISGNTKGRKEANRKEISRQINDLCFNSRV
ncbi:MAG: hypothetical protein ACTFAL_00320 [Candidatus Electronema sp. V4]|uniref:hypothetical protein n=1 Tax=Candidatus Electronema sp. V4 TaxID=3454756 RepID=UPI004055833D